MRALPALLLISCADPLRDEFYAAQAEAQADPGAAPASWEPDAILHLSGALVDRMARVALDGSELWNAPQTVGNGLAKIELNPSLAMESVRIRGTDRCPSCVAVDLVVAGKVGWKAALGSGELPVRVRTELDATLSAERDGRQFVMTMAPGEVRSVELLGGGGVRGQRLPESAEKLLKERLQESLAEIPPYEIGRYDDVALRALKILPTANGLSIAMLTTAPKHTAIPTTPPRLANGWELALSNTTLVAMARKSAFDAGALSGDVLVEPLALNLERGGFQSDVRVWHASTPYWWRDYAVNGTIVFQEGTVKLVASQISDKEASAAAGPFQPLITIGEKQIAAAFSDSLSAALPRSAGAAVGERNVAVEVASLSANEGVVRVRGQMQWNRPARGASAPRR